MKRLALSLSALFSISLAQQIPIIITSIPKGGTHLLMKAVTLITGKQPGYLAPITGQQYTVFDEKSAQKVLASGKAMIFSHLHYNDEAAETLTKHNFPVLFIYRDPRDLLLAAARLVTKRGMPVPEALGLAKPWASRHDEYVLQLINNITDIYANFTPWLEHPNVYAVRFEDLVGPKGGGSAEKQLRVLRDIANHINMPLTETEATKIAEKLFGQSATFRKGQIGAWKVEFTTEHKQLFKQKGQALLEQLGYELDDQWAK